MKKLLIATLLFTGLVAFVPNASAGHRDRYRDYDNCDNRYREVYRPSYRCYDERPVYYRAAPVVRYRSYDYDNCRPAYRTYRRPSVSFAFGF